MKKIIFILLCLIIQFDVVKAFELESISLPYYVTINNEIVNVKKVYDKDTLNVVFNMDYKNYNTNNNFSKYSEINYKNYGMFHSKINFFNNIVYYGYNQNPNDLNYYLTQSIIWSLICNYTVNLVDSAGNVIDNYQKEYNKIFNDSLNHNSEAYFINKTYNEELWNNKNFNYYSHIVLNNLDIDGLIIKTENQMLNIYNEKVGNYTIELFKDYDQENYSYNDGVNIYWQNLLGPADINKKFYYNVTGIKLTINENLIGVNGKIGDAHVNSKYELYLDNELKLIIDNLEENYLKSNSSYVLKSISDDIGINNIDEIKFDVTDLDYILNIDKYVISKNISLDILDDNIYYVYLKSNQELYEIIDKNSDLITLPYGIYFITDQNDFYQELEVTNNIDQLLTIDNHKDIIEESNSVLDITNDLEQEDETDLEEQNEINLDQKEKIDLEQIDLDNINIKEDIEIEEINPQTLDNIYYYLKIFLFSLLFILSISFAIKNKVLYKGKY